MRMFEMVLCVLTVGALSACSSWEGICRDGCEQSARCSSKAVDIDKCTNDCVADADCYDNYLSGSCMSATESAGACTASLNCDEMDQFARGILGQLADYPCKAEMEAITSECTQEEVTQAGKSC